MNLNELFGVEKPIIGMIHLAGGKEAIKRGLEELMIYQEEGIDGAIIEDYHGSSEDVYRTLKESDSLGLKIVRGINLLKDDPSRAFKLAKCFGGRFVQLDSVQTKDLHLIRYERLRKEYSDIAVFGGIGFKYTKPTGNPLEQDLEEGKSRCDVIVTTGKETGKETPIQKLRDYRKVLGNFPLGAGAGVNKYNVYEQMKIVDIAIVGSSFKPKTKEMPNGDTSLPVERMLVKEFMHVVKDLRAYQKKTL